MRDLKFRGIAACDVGETSVKMGDMLFGQLVGEGGTPFIVGPVVESDEEYISLETWCPVNPETVGQFTGLLDKNGVTEVYEGDIINGDGLVKGNGNNILDESTTSRVYYNPERGK